MFGYCSSMGVGGWLLIAAFWAGFIGVVVWAVSRLFPDGKARGGADELLAKRLAAGEIDPQAYREAREQLAAGQRR